MLEYFRFKEIHDLYTSGQIEEARHQLSELQGRYVNLCDENAVLRTQIQGYEDILYLSRSLIFDGIFFWLVTGSIKQGPFCPVCYNRDGLLLRLADDSVVRRCGMCSSRYERGGARMDRAVSDDERRARTRQDAADEAAPSALSTRRKAVVIPFGK